MQHLKAPLESLLRPRRRPHPQSSLVRHYPPLNLAHPSDGKTKVTLEHFEIRQLLGKGAFGEVCLCPRSSLAHAPGLSCYSQGLWEKNGLEADGQKAH